MNLIKQIYNLPTDDKETWDLICNGNVLGIFQLSGLGQHYSKRLKPRNIRELADLISIIRPACISGDTKIKVKTYDYTTRYVSIKDMYNEKNKYQTILSYDEINGIYKENSVKDIIYSGQKEIYKLNIIPGKILSRFNSTIDLKCTLDHKILTPNGWIELKDLKFGNRVAINRHHKKYRLRSNNIFGEKYFQEICYKMYEYNCVMCDWSDGSLDVNHLIGNRKTDNSPENLCYLCPNHHRMYSEKNLNIDDIIENRKRYILPQSESIIWGQYLGCESCGIDDVYDIMMESPHHNFIAGGVVVHNCLDVKVKGKTITDSFCDRKNGTEEVISIHPAVEECLKDSYQYIVYQESCLRLANEIAGFSLVQSDILRKSIGVKDVTLMAGLEKEFIDGCKQTGKVDEVTAKQLFENIRASQRYAFNLSHAIAYATISFWDSYLKYHYPLDFYVEKLNQSHHKIKPKVAVNQLVTDALRNGINIRSPKLEDVLTDEVYSFYHKDSEIIFGINHIKGIGEAKIVKNREKLSNIRAWMDCLQSGIDKTTLTNLISSGFFSFGTTRKQKLFEYNLFSKLSDREKKLAEESTGVRDAFVFLLDNVNVKRREIIESLIKTLDNPPYGLDDDPSWIHEVEKELLGISLSYHKTETEISDADTTCKELNDGKSGNSIVFVEISDPREYNIKRGKMKGEKMGSFSGSDHTGTSNFLLFGETWTKYQSLLYEGAVVTLAGEKSKDAMIVKVVK